MFHLEQSIAVWRRQMLAAGIKAPVPLDELESHLRDEIEREMKSGLSLDEPEAFSFAIQKIGKADALKTEFTKIDETKHARKRKLMKFFAPALAFLCLLWCSYLLVTIEMSATERISGFVTVVLSVLKHMSTTQIIGIVGGILGSLIGLFGAAIGIFGGIAGAYFGFRKAKQEQKRLEDSKHAA